MHLQPRQFDFTKQFSFFLLLASISNQGWTGAGGSNKHRSSVPGHVYAHTHTA